MEKKQQFYGLDILKFVMAVLVAARHMIQVFYAADSRWRLLVGSWLSNLAVPVFFIIAGFLLFRKVPSPRDRDRGRLSAGDGKGAADAECAAGHADRGSACELRRTARRTVLTYCWRILKLYLLWCVIYWPIDIYNWYHGTQSVREFAAHYIRSFFFSSTIAQLWYLPALIVACLIVWLCYSWGMSIWQILFVTGILFVMGCIGDNWYFTQYLPQDWQQLIYAYGQHFMTMRNGVFYGSFYVCLGLLFAKKSWKLPLWMSAAGSVVFVYAAYREVRHCQNINMVFMAAPAACCLVEAALQLRLADRKLYPRLRAMSEWVYLSHFYFFYIFSWTAPWNPVPLTERNIMLFIFVPMVVFAWCMACLAERQRFAGIRRLI